MADSNSGGLEQSFSAALKAAESSPTSDDAWDHLEDLADQLQRPEEVAELYRKVIGGSELSGADADTIAERAVQFHEEWFGDTPEVVDDLLLSIVNRDSEAQWAFERLTVRLTAGESWDKLLGAYDSLLAAVRDRDRKQQLLDDAAHIAKDFAHQGERAAGYMHRQLELDPDNTQLLGSLERILERQAQWDELIDLWRERLDRLATTEAQAVRVKIAITCLEQLGDTGRALAELRTLLEEAPGHADGCAQLERILASAEVEPGLRREALSILRKNYDSADREHDVVRLLEAALSFVDDDEARRIHRDLAVRLSILQRDDEAMRHYGSLLQIDPTDTDARKQLRQLATRASRFDMLVDALLAAAGTAEPAVGITLILEGADLRRDNLEDADGAIELYQRVLDSDAGDRVTSLAAAHALDELLASTDRAEDRLAVLERLAELERAKAVRRSIHGEAAKLAAELGDVDRALASWRRRLEENDNDLEALDAVVGLNEQTVRWDEVVDALRQRAASATFDQQRRADLVRIAEVRHERLGQLEGAIATWREILDQFGAASDVLAALDALMTEAAQWTELAQVLDSATGPDRTRAAALLGRLGEVRRTHLDDAEGALAALSHALQVDPRQPQARAGLQELLVHPDVGGRAAEILAVAYEATDDWRERLELTYARVDNEHDVGRQVRILVAAARALEHRAGEPAQAMARLAEALPRDPSNLAIEAGMRRLAEATAAWSELATGLSLAAEAAVETPERAAQLWTAAGDVQSRRLDDAEKATNAYAQAVGLAPGRAELVEKLTETAAGAGMWGTACDALVRAMKMRDRQMPQLLERLEQAADESEGWDALAQGLETVLRGEGHGLRSSLVAVLLESLAEWRSVRLGDKEGAREAMARAVEAEPTNLEALRKLSELQGELEKPERVETLRRIFSLSPRSVGALREAADIARTHDDDATFIELATQLHRVAASSFARGERLDGEATAQSLTLWATDALTEAFLASGARERAISLLAETAALPFEATRSQQLRIRAAELCVEDEDRGRAIDFLGRVLDERTDDVELVRRTAELCAAEDRINELMTLRRRELELTDDPARRLELRLDIARLAGILEGKGGRLAALTKNLEERPGDPDTIAAVTELLEERGRYGQLTELLEAQAAAIEGDEPERAATLWHKVARTAESELSDPSRAIAGYERMVALVASNEAFDALARLNLDQENPQQAAKWLQRRLEQAQAQERVALLLRLARARLAAGQRGEAIDSLEAAFEEAPRNAGVRKLLIRLYREREDWSALARTLARAAENVGDEATVLAYAREAATLFNEQLDRPADAVPVLEKAVALVPDDRGLKLMLGRGLRVADRLDDARLLLEDLVGLYGRRRSAERAAVHHELAKVYASQGQTEGALDELDAASKMDAGNAQITRDLGEYAREAGQLDRAERAYRTLLLNVRRSGHDVAATGIGPAGVLIQLSSIASERGETDQANELVESALEALANDDTEAPQLQRKLERQGNLELLQRVLEARLAQPGPGHKRARVHAEMAALLEQRLERPADALASILEAVAADAGAPAYHDEAIRLARELGEFERYVQKIDALLESARRDADRHARAELLLRLAEAKAEAGDQDAAQRLLERAEATGVRQVDVWRAQVKVAGLRGDQEAQLALLERLAALGEDQAGTRADAMYRMAEVRLADADTIDAGLESMLQALEEDARYERAAMILRAAADVHADHVGILDLYERAARRSEDRGTLLHYLECRAMHEDGQSAHCKEAVDVAMELEQTDRGEALMERAVEIADASLEGRPGVAWALIGLAERRRDAGDLAGAVKWLGEATEHGELKPVLALAQSVAEAAAGAGGDLTLAARVYEQILARDATVRAAWEPLAGLYRGLGDLEKLERLVEETLDGLDDPSERNALRRELARAALADEGRVETAISVLRDAVLEDPNDAEANVLLADCLEKTGDEEGMMELLRNQFYAAQAAKDGGSIKTAALALGRRLETSDRFEAATIYRNALEEVPSDADVLRALINMLDDEEERRERAELTERLLASDPGEDGPRRALELVGLYEQMEDDAAALRALGLAQRLAPRDAEIRERLQATYRERGDHEGLVRSLVEAAEASEVAADKVSFLEQAARIERDDRLQPARSADLLARAAELDPERLSLRVELGRTHAAAGDSAQASAVLGEVLEAAEDPALRLDVLRARIDVNKTAGDHEAVLRDLEAAFAIDAAAVAEDLEEVLEAQRAQAEFDRDVEVERPLVLRLVDVRLTRGARDEARQLLETWVDRERKDIEALYRLRDLETEDERWESLAKLCNRLVAITKDEEQLDAAMRLAQACQQLGQPEEARRGLEHARRKQPDAPRLREALREIYEAAGAHKELGRLLLEDAATAEGDAKADLLERAVQLLLHEGDTELALPALDELRQLRPDDAYTVALLADAYVAQDRLDEADTVLDDAIEARKGRRSPEMAAFLHRKSRVAAARGDRRGQLDLLQQAHMTDKNNPDVTLELADLSEALEEWDLAIKVLRSITVSDQEGPISRTQALLRQAKIAFKREDRQRALLWGRRALQEDPADEEVKAFLAELGE